MQRFFNRVTGKQIKININLNYKAIAGEEIKIGNRIYPTCHTAKDLLKVCENLERDLNDMKHTDHKRVSLEIYVSGKLNGEEKNLIFSNFNIFKDYIQSMAGEPKPCLRMRL